MPKLPPGPNKVYMLQTLLDPSRGDFAALAREYGDPVTVPTLMGPLVMTTGSEGNRALFTADAECFAPTMPQLGTMLKDSVLFQTGAAHRRARKLMTPPFHGARMRAYGELMRAAVRRHVRSWQPGRPFTMLDTTQAITLEVIIQAIFGVAGSEQIPVFRQKLLAVLEGFSPLFLIKAFQRPFLGLGPWARFVRDDNRLRAHMHALIEEHRNSEQEDVLSLLLSARDEEGQGLGESEIMDQLFTLVVAGHETTAVTLAWAFYLLHRSPEVLERLRAEIATLPDPDSADPEAIGRLPYLEAVCNETMRLYPPVHLIHRRLARPMNLLGWELPTDTPVGIGVYATHRQARYYPDPERFQPERFLEKTYSPFEFLPWGGGVRRCLGAPFAMFEMKIVLATILQHHRLRLLEREEVKWINRAGTASPKGGIRMELI